MKEIAIVILNYKNWLDTVECIESFNNQEYLNYRLIVVENGSENNSIDSIINELKIKDQSCNKERKFIQYSQDDTLSENIISMESSLINDDVVFIDTEKNLGFSGGNNVGAKYAEKLGYEYVLLLNSDTIINDLKFLEKLTLPFENDDSVYLTGPNIVNYDGTFDSPFNEDSFWGDLFYSGILNRIRQLLQTPSYYININAISSPFPSEVYRVSGACMMFRTEYFCQIDYFDENVWLSCEEAIVAEKIKKKNGKTIFQPLTTLIHKKAQSPRPKSDKYNIMKNHYKQRTYYYKEYKNYSSFQIRAITLIFAMRLYVIKVMG